MNFENGFRLSVDEVKKNIRKETRLISITNPHNPTGTVIAENELRELIRLAEEKNIFLLVDETYRDLNFGEKPQLAASLSENVISISSVSKAHGLPGLRMGWMITKNKKLQELFWLPRNRFSFAIPYSMKKWCFNTCSILPRAKLG